jgi:hypothetical protein
MLAAQVIPQRLARHKAITAGVLRHPYILAVAEVVQVRLVVAILGHFMVVMELPQQFQVYLHTMPVVAQVVME